LISRDEFGQRFRIKFIGLFIYLFIYLFIFLLHRKDVKKLIGDLGANP